MFTKPSDIEAKLDDEIVRVLDKMAPLDPRSAEYAEYGERLSVLYKLRPETRPKQLSPDTMLVVAANLAGIFWLTIHEHERVINSKALGFILKPH